jgi:hypothetical protein
MKLPIFLLASVFHLCSGFSVELRGELTEEACTGEEYADFSSCTTVGTAGNPLLPMLAQLQGEAFVNPGGNRELSCVTCTGGAPRGTYCFTMCGGRRRLEEGADMHDSSRRLDEVAIFEDGAYTGNPGAVHIAEAIMECFLGDDSSTNHPCLGNTLSLIVTL